MCHFSVDWTPPRAENSCVMKNIFLKAGAALLALVVCSFVSLQAQNVDLIKKKARTAGALVNVSKADGKTIVTYQGNEVWSGKAKGIVTAKSKVVGGTTYVAAFDGDKVIWENTPGAGKQVK